MRTNADILTEELRAYEELAAKVHALMTMLVGAQNALLELQAGTAAGRARLAGRLAEVAVRVAAEPPSGPGLDGAQAAERAGLDGQAQPIPRLRSRVAQLIVNALAEAGDTGLSGQAINEIVVNAQYTKDASEKAKLFLKRNGLARHDKQAMHWYSIGKGPKNIAGEQNDRKRAIPENLGRVRSKPKTNANSTMK
ncbi:MULTISPECIES: hypothetical protein [Methylobacterium]|jgi:hypothetical protein|uniref:Uncharacterized protein n=1 Tax=Methylobacterium nonmethylotrophicum TaxID=1141884 RepID=A0A4Z0NQ50_9HYPH|nr:MULTISPECIES: hypothetical protein [Methylobacterium]TGD97920.1 hypothetical protein EU555_17270 [Methylobacterium nonmethylotrophicum]